MLTSDFDFDLPDRCIAHQPARPRDAARLLVVGAALEDRLVRDLPDLLRPGDMLVSNDTRVIPAQLSAMRGNARIGITLDRPRPDGAWHALARNARRLAPGDTLVFSGAENFTAEVIERDPDGGVALAGRHCESGDVMLTGVELPQLAPGDLVAFATTGAYVQSMASTYNGAVRPAAVLIEGGVARAITRRETIGELLARDID